MNLIASENYYQRRIEKLKHIELDIAQENSRMTPAELEAEESRMNKCLERAFQKYEEYQTATIFKPSYWRRWRFRRVTEMALAIAKYFEFNVHIEADDIKGWIKMRGDPILLDAASWNDSEQKRQLLCLLRCAESIWIDVAEE